MVSLSRLARSSSSIRCCVPILVAFKRPERIQRRTVSGSRLVRRAASGTVSIVATYYNKSSGAPQELMGWIEWSEDRFELRVVRVDDDIGRVEREPLPPVCLEPIWAFRADQREHAATRSRPLELEDHVGIGWNAGARHGQISPGVHNRESMEETSAYVGAWASAGKNSSQP